MIVLYTCSISFSSVFIILSQEHYLPFILQSKLKLWSIEGSDRGFEVFLEKSLREDDTRQLMESRYPEQVTLYYIMKGDMDRAQYYLSISLQAFLQVCLPNTTYSNDL